MRCTFNYPCRIGVVLPDSSMSAMEFDRDDVVEVARIGSVTGEAWAPRDLELEDGTLLVNVPPAALSVESTVAHA